MSWHPTTRPRPVLAALLAAMVAVLGLTVPAHAAPAPGTLAVTLVDDTGAPMTGYVIVYDTDSQEVTRTGEATVEVELPPGPYGVFAMTPWGGFQCVGLVVCTYLVGGAIAPDGTVTVAEGETTEVRIEAPPPARMTGAGRVGSPLQVVWSPGMVKLDDYLAGFGFGPRIAWLRNGKPIAGADEATYEPTLADVGRSISARLSYDDAMQVHWQSITAGPVPDRTTRSVRVAKVTTRSFGYLSAPTVRSGRPVRVRIEVTAPDLVVTGPVTVAVDRWERTVRLRNGGARVTLPDLPAGRHRVEVRYPGTSAFQSSTARPRTLTVTAG